MLKPELGQAGKLMIKLLILPKHFYFQSYHRILIDVKDTCLAETLITRSRYIKTRGVLCII